MAVVRHREKRLGVASRHQYMMPPGQVVRMPCQMTRCPAHVCRRSVNAPATAFDAMHASSGKHTHPKRRANRRPRFPTPSRLHAAKPPHDRAARCTAIRMSGCGAWPSEATTSPLSQAMPSAPPPHAPRRWRHAVGRTPTAENHQHAPRTHSAHADRSTPSAGGSP